MAREKLHKIAIRTTLITLFLFLAAAFVLRDISTNPANSQNPAPVPVEIAPTPAASDTAAVPSKRNDSASDREFWTGHDGIALNSRPFDPPASLLGNKPLPLRSLIRLECFDGRTVEGFVRDSFINVNGTVSTTAVVKDSAWGRIFIANTRGKLLARIRIPEENRILAIDFNPADGRHHLLDLPPRLAEPEEPPDDARPVPAAAPAAENAPAAGFSEATDGVQVDVMMPFDSTALTRNGADRLNNRIALAVAYANDAHANTGSGITLNLVRSYAIDYTGSRNLYTDLKRLTYGDHYDPWSQEGDVDYMADVHAARDACGADFVCLIVGNASGGIAWLLNTPAGDPFFAFSVIDDGGMESYLAAHEIGHNMGLHHAADQNFQPGPTGGLIGSDAAGWHWHPVENRAGYGSVMTYTGKSYFDDNLSHTRVGLFSDPDLTDHGMAAGDAVLANNARVLRRLKNIYAAYREPAYSPVLSWSADTFTEDAADEGTVSDTLTVTLSDDSFTPDVVSGEHVTASNIPAGLTAVFTRTSDTHIVLSLAGAADAHAHDDDLSNLTVVFTDGAFARSRAAQVEGSTVSDLCIDFIEIPVVTVARSAASILETGTGAFFLLRTGDAFVPLTVPFTVDGTAVSGIDYASLGNSALFPAGAASVPINLLPVDDALIEGDETVTLTLGSGAFLAGDPCESTVTIVSNDAALSIRMIDPSAAETGSDTAVFEVIREGYLDNALFVDWTVTGTATEGSDYLPIGSGGLLPAGSEALRITVIPVDDTAAETAETVSVTLGEGTWQVGSPASADMIIVDNDVRVEISAVDGLASENGPDNGTFRITRSAALPTALTVSLSIGGTALNGTDYAALPAFATIPAGETSILIPLRPLDDGLIEETETAELVLLPRLDYSVAEASRALVRLADDDALPLLTLRVVDGEAGEDGAAGLFALHRSGDCVGILEAGCTLSGTAVNGMDFAPVEARFVFADGCEVAFLSIEPMDDALLEGEETVVLAVDDGNWRKSGDCSGTISITDNDDLPVVEITATRPNAFEATAAPGTCTLNRTGDCSSSLTVFFIVTGTATAGTDYATPAGVITFAEGAREVVLTLTPIDDETDEGGNETITITLCAGAGYSPGARSSASVTIADDDCGLTAVGVEAADASASEDGPDSGAFVITRSVSAGSLTVRFKAGGTARGGADFEPLDGSIAFADGETEKVIHISPYRDNRNEGEETVTLTILPDDAYTVSPSSEKTVFLADSGSSSARSASSGGGGGGGCSAGSGNGTGNPGAVTLFLLLLLAVRIGRHLMRPGTARVRGVFAPSKTVPIINAERGNESSEGKY